MADAVIKIVDLVTHYDSRKILDGVNGEKERVVVMSMIIHNAMHNPCECVKTKWELESMMKNLGSGKGGIGIEVLGLGDLLSGRRHR